MERAAWRPRGADRSSLVRRIRDTLVCLWNTGLGVPYIMAMIQEWDDR